MASASDILTNATEEYHLSVNDVKFWTPYWINWAKPPYHLDAPLVGKGTPTELRSALLDILAQTDQPPRTEDGYRSLMKQHGLGVDCSALAYHILERLVRDLTDQDLAEHLFAPKNDIIEASQKLSWQEAGVSQPTLDALPDQITIAEVSRLFKRNPRHITNVARLTAEAATKAVSASDIQPGDMIKMTSAAGDHLGVVISVAPDKIRYADSREIKQSNGVRYQDILITNPGQNLDQQDWPDVHDFNPNAGDRVCRLKVLDGRV